MVVLAILYLIFFLLGFNLNWISNPYDEYRLLQIYLTIIIGMMTLFKLKEQKKIVNNDHLFLILLLIVLAKNLYFQNIYVVYDLIMWMNLIILFIGLRGSIECYKNNEKLFVLLVFASIVPCFFIILSIIQLLQSGVFYAWQMNAGSIRIYDSVIVPIFWIAVYLHEKNKYINKFYPVICFFIALALLVDGARSAIISLIIPLILLFLLDSNYKKLTVKTIIFFGLALLAYQLTFYFYNQIYHKEVSLSISRYSSSYRSDIWLYMFEQWKLNPFWGVGGGYLAQVQYPYGHHMHNAYLRLIFEWGFIGLVGLIWILNKMYSLMKSNVNVALKMGVLAILIDAMFSGNFIYPASQVACALFLALAFSQQDQMKFENNEFQNTTQQYLNTKTLYIACYLFFVVIVFVYLRYDMLCFGCSSDEGRAAPFFWEHGASQMLSKRDE